MSEQAKFLEGSLFKHISVMSLTASVGLMAVFLVDFVDMIFISMLGKAELAAAIGYAGAILFFTSSFGICDEYVDLWCRVRRDLCRDCLAKLAVSVGTFGGRRRNA